MAGKYNLKNPAVKRIMQEARELATESCYEYEAHPLEDNLFEWHFTVRGPGDTEFEDGRYHGRILLPAEYPFKPPELIFLTPNGRFELNTKVCLSITGYHPEYWQPAWGIRTVILAVMGFFPTEARGAIGGLDYTKEERQLFAKKSNTWTCSVCQQSNDTLLSDNAPRNQRPRDEDIPTFSLTYRSANPDAKEAELDKKETNEKGGSENDMSEKDTDEKDESEKSTTNTPAEKSSKNVESAHKQSPSLPSSSSFSSRSTKKTTLSPNANQSTTNNNSNGNSSISSQITVQNQPNRPPLWLDVLIGALVMLVFALVARRYI
ncbi:ubiquitin-conjugating enzyme/RWD-like protein [Fennellomyces sp. T-0311]|nr:ubiquitin-conjugating enzyme/RWD-like protein [Fennellomyces sp. T-0311]